jgi:uncharacterized protein YegP (UPF0339 family)
MHPSQEAAMSKKVSAKSVVPAAKPARARSAGVANEIPSRGRSAGESASDGRNVRSMFKFKIVQDWRGEYRWQLMSRGGQVLAMSDDSYPSVDAVKRDVRGMRPELATAPIEVARRVAA